jgi:hypothetical protein
MDTRRDEPAAGDGRRFNLAFAETSCILAEASGILFGAEMSDRA